jgi:broad specificity phosphatase PhoE
VNLYLVRHGQTAYNRDGLGLGRADAPLTELGMRQAEALGARFSGVDVDCVYSSPLARCLVTARAIAGERPVPIAVSEDLIELDVGHTEGLTFAAMREQYAEFLQAWAGPDGARAIMPGGESLAHVRERVERFIETITEQGGEHVVVASHNFVTRTLVTSLLGLEQDAFRSFSVDLASLTTIVRMNNRTVIRSLNDCCHLSGIS